MLSLPSILTHREARAVQRTLAEAVQQALLRNGAGPEVAVDASGLQRFDSAALAVLIECQRLAQASGKGLAVRQAPPKLVELARLYGVDGLLALPGAVGTPA